MLRFPLFQVSLPAEVSNPLPVWAWVKMKVSQVSGYMVIYLSFPRGVLESMLKTQLIELSFW